MSNSAGLVEPHTRCSRVWPMQPPTHMSLPARPDSAVCLSKRENSLWSAPRWKLKAKDKVNEVPQLTFCSQIPQISPISLLASIPRSPTPNKTSLRLQVGAIPLSQAPATALLHLCDAFDCLLAIQNTKQPHPVGYLAAALSSCIPPNSQTTRAGRSQHQCLYFRCRPPFVRLPARRQANFTEY